MKDPDNPCIWRHSEETIFAKNGHLLPFQLIKHLPKLRMIQNRFGLNGSLRILDIGIGYGAFLHLLEQSGYRNISGMDPFPVSLQISRRHTSANLKEGKIEDENWPFEPHSFDVITSFDVIEHLEDPPVFFKRCHQYLKPDGMVMVTTPNRSVFYQMRSLPFIGIPDRNPTHINVHGAGYWTKLARKEGYNIASLWFGEILTHIKYLPRMVYKLGKWLHIDLSKTPIFRSLQQSVCMALSPVRSL